MESPWKYAIFFADRLEIHPSPLFTISGSVHTNSSLYTAHDTLTFGSKVTYSDDWSIGFAPEINRTRGKSQGSAPTG